MKAIREIEYQYFSLESLMAIYMVSVAFSKGKKGVYLTNSCLRQILPTKYRVNQSRIDDFVEKVSHIFPYHKTDPQSNGCGLILGVTDEADNPKNREPLKSLPDEAEMLKKLGFKTQNMVIS